MAQADLFSKKIPTWASNFDLLTRVVKIQAQQRELGQCTCKASVSRQTTGFSTTCQCLQSETYEARHVRIAEEKKALAAKVQWMIKEKQLRNMRTHFGSKGKANLLKNE